MKKFIVLIISIITLTYISNLQGAMAFAPGRIVKGIVENINKQKNFITINGTKYFYNKTYERTLENKLNEKITISVKKMENKFFIIKIISGKKLIKRY